MSIPSPELRKALLSGEKVLWEGQPSHGLLFRPIDWLLIPFSMFWAGFALFWNAGVWTTNAPLAFKLFGLPFLAAGIYITFGRFLIDKWTRQHLTYAVTDRRILILRSNGRSSTAVDLKQLPTLNLREKADGSGTIRFGAPESYFGARNFGIWQPAHDATPQFLGIASARSVYEIIQKQKMV